MKVQGRTPAYRAISVYEARYTLHFDLWASGMSFDIIILKAS